MGADERRLRLQEPPLDDAEEDEEGAEEELEVGRLQALLQDRRRLALGALAIVLVVVGIYILFPTIVGTEEAVEKLDDAVWYWLVVAVALNVAAFAAYVALFRGVLSGTVEDEVHRRLDMRASYQITMAGLAATRIFSAGGAGGIVLTYWALRKAGMPRRRAGCRMVAFLVLTYFIYLAALIIFGILLRTGVLPGSAPLAGTIVPAALAAIVIGVFLLIARIPHDIERRIQRFGQGYRHTRYLTRLAKGPATIATGVRTAIFFIRSPSRGALGVTGAVGFWGANIGVLWASFEAFGGDVPFAVLVQGFFVGMAANLIPSPAGGVGSVDAGMIGAFLLFDIPTSIVFPAVLTYRVIAFWLPIPPGIVAFFQLRRTVARWEREREEEAARATILQKVK